MIRPTCLSIFFAALILFCAFTGAQAQINSQLRDDAENPTQQNRPKLLEALQLTQPQIRELRAVNREYQPPLREARQRMRAANQALDDAVYGGQDDEMIIRARLKEAQIAHSEFLKARTDSESAIAKILNPNQLIRFRQLRRQNAQANAVNNRIDNQIKPAPRRLNNLQKQIRNRRIQRRNNL